MRARHNLAVLVIGLLLVLLGISFWQHAVQVQRMTLPSSLSQMSFTLSAPWSGVSSSFLSQQSDPELEEKLVQLGPCDDVLWCALPMPLTSHFRLTAPSDPLRWRRAQLQAIRGEHVLLQRIARHFPHWQDFLDGDVAFRHQHHLADVFVDRRNGLAMLTNLSASHSLWRDSTQDEGEREVLVPALNADEYPPGMPPRYNAVLADRAPVVQLGYFAFTKTQDHDFFQGSVAKRFDYNRVYLLNAWRTIRQELRQRRAQFRSPFILISNLDENWGIFSTHFPNRTTKWDTCCSAADLAVIYDILSENATLLFLTQQHHNLTHPKLLSLPRGLPLRREAHTARYIWDLMHTIARNETHLAQKDTLVYTASSQWGYRETLKKCIRENFRKEKHEQDIVFDSYTKELKGRLDEEDYFQRLVSARMTIALSGLGYDTFRLWEALTLGLVPVMERGVGLDKTVWKLPVLLVDDFADVTPSLLRSAYVEALYQVDEFEFERLKQSWWDELILQTSATQSNRLFLERFPPHAEDPSFARPAVPFDCWKRNGCGKNTKRIPRRIC